MIAERAGMPAGRHKSVAAVLAARFRLDKVAATVLSSICVRIVRIAEYADVPALLHRYVAEAYPTLFNLVKHAAVAEW